MPESLQIHTLTAYCLDRPNYRTVREAGKLNDRHHDVHSNHCSKEEVPSAEIRNLYSNKIRGMREGKWAQDSPSAIEISSCP